MHSNDFEKAFDDFLGSEVYDRGEDALFTLARTAFIAGWKAAGGELPEPHRPVQGLSGQERSGQ